MPQGIYKLRKVIPKRGDVVGACIPDSFATLALDRGYLPKGMCKNGTKPVMKYVAAVPGDVVEVKLDGIQINSDSVPNTRSYQYDLLGKPIPNRLGVYTLQEGEHWLLSNHDSGSLDSRYFGPITKTLGVVEPVFIKKDLCQLKFANVFLRC